jgi:hypothetical protein
MVRPLPRLATAYNVGLKSSGFVPAFILDAAARISGSMVV